MLIVFARLIFAMLAQALVAGLYSWQGHPTPWRAAAPWWIVYGTLIDIGCLVLLGWLIRREGIRLLDLVSFQRQRLGHDILLGFGFIVLYLILAIGGAIAFGLLVYGTTRAPAIMAPLPLWGALYSLLVWPVIWTIAEEMTYQGYALPWLEALSGRVWLAVIVMGFGWVLQHSAAVHARLAMGSLSVLEELPEADLALEVKGLGSILVAGCLSEIQDTRRFTTGQEYDQKRKQWRERTYRDGQAGVANLAGLWWPRHDSGQFVAQNRRLARERNPYLRFWFVQVAYSLKGNQADYAAYYRKKYRETLRHKHQRALILTARKAVRLIFALLHKGQMERHEEEATNQ